MIPSDFNSATRKYDGWSTYSDNLRSNEGEGGLRGDTPPANESARGTRNVMVLDKRTGIFPVAEADPKIYARVEETKPGLREVALPIVVWSTSEVNNDSEDDKANDGQDLDGTGDANAVIQSGLVNRQDWFKIVFTHANTNSVSPYAPTDLG
jgi:hypothetical protein